MGPGNTFQTGQKRPKVQRITEAATDNDLVRRFCAGEEQAFNNLYARHHRKVFWLCLRMVRDPIRAEDLTQEAFLQLYRKIRTFRGDSAFSTWLHRVAVNVVLMSIRKKKQRPEVVSLEETMNPEDSDAAPREFGEEDRELENSVERLLLDDAIQSLPPGYRQVLILHDIHGYEHQEIAECLGCSTGNSKSQLFKARHKLRTFLRRAGEYRRPRAA